MNYFRKNKFQLSYISIILLVFLSFSCSETEIKKTLNESLLNTNHLESLYKKIKIDENTSIGTIWIYCNAPDYQVITDDGEGFTCVDDVARALVFYCRQYKSNASTENLEKVISLTNFIKYMSAKNGYFYNFMFPDESINTTHKNSVANANFWSWRALWALSELQLLNNPELSELKAKTKPLIDNLIINIELLFSTESEIIVFEGIELPRVLKTYGSDQLSLIMIGLTNYYQITKSENIKNLLLKLGNYVKAAQFGNKKTFPHYAFLSWKNHWHAWGNSQAYSLLYAGRILENNELIEAGLNEVDYFYPFVMNENFINSFKVIKENNLLIRQDYQKFSQIAYGIRPMVFASLEAYKITNEDVYATRAADLAKWFFGNNPTNKKMYNHNTGIAYDGINSENSINLNSGAESTIEVLLSIQAIETNEIAKQIIQNF